MSYYDYFSAHNIFIFSNAFRAFCLVIFFYELYWAYKNKKRIATLKQVLVNFATGAVVIYVSAVGVKYVYFQHIWKALAMASPLYGFWRNSILAFFALLLAMDFTYYVAHRLAHKIPLLWVLHASHHSDNLLNTSTGIRVSFTCFTVLLFSPAALMGVPPMIFWAALNFCVLYPVWLHTQCIPRNRVLEWVFVTPSSHRVHHGTNEIYKDKNYGLIFTFFDRIFGTFVPETEAPIYHDKHMSTNNFFGIQFVGLKMFYRYTKSRWNKRFAPKISIESGTAAQSSKKAI